MGAVVMLAIAALAVVSIFVATNTYTRVNHGMYVHERAFQMAVSGLLASILEMNAARSGDVQQGESRAFFSATNGFKGSTWGFSTVVSNVSPTLRRIVSTGTYGDSSVRVEANVEAEADAQNIHALYALALYAGNSSGDTNYVLDIGGTGSGADYVNGDVYSGNDIAVTGDAELRHPEDYTDSSSNALYDTGEDYVHSGTTQVFSNSVTQAQLDSYSNSVASGQMYPNGSYNYGEAFVDTIGNGVYDSGETYTDLNSDDAYQLGEPFEDRNSTYDAGEAYFDDRNKRYDYGTAAVGSISGMPAPGPGQAAADGNDDVIDPPDLDKMYYELQHGVVPPADANTGWGHDVSVADSAFDSNGEILDANDPAHIFVKNPTDRSYSKIDGKDDYFFEDPTDATYGDDSQFITLSPDGNEKVYYVDGNVYLHNVESYDFMFRNPGGRITIVANGNITISDEFWYNGGTANPIDSLALIAKKDAIEPNSGNIYLGDAQFGTGGDIHAMLYAENNFVDNNLDTSGQPYLSVYGSMSAGNQVALNRGGDERTRLDVTLDERIVNSINLPPGLPQAQTGQRSINIEGSWSVIRGSWSTASALRHASYN